jgi:K+-transporting ATPase KdpF subunit
MDIVYLGLIAVFRRGGRLCRPATNWGASNECFYVLGAVVSAGLLVYLVVALLKAEEL